MKKQSAKRRRRDDGDDGSVISIDRLSESPQPILHHILSLLSQKDAVRTCLLSQAWRYLWHGRSNVEFTKICEEETFQKIMSSCPLIENLDVKRCNGLTTIKLNNDHNLKHFGCMYASFNEPSIEIESPCLLESIRILYCRNWFHHNNYTFFSRLKRLYLRWVQFSEDSFVNFSYNFPCLNELTLDLCHGLEDFILSSSSIKRFIINMREGQMIKAIIDIPNILCFECTGSDFDFMPSIKFRTSNNEWKSHVSVGCKLKTSDSNDATTWFRELNDLLQGLSQSRISLDFVHQRYKNLNTPLHIQDCYGGDFLPVVVNTLRLSGYFLPSSVPSILNCFFRIFRPRYVQMNQYASSKARASYKKENNRLAEFICKLIPKEIEHPSLGYECRRMALCPG